MTHWDPPAWDPPVVGGDRTPTPTSPAQAAHEAPRLPPATVQHAPPTVVQPTWPNLTQPAATKRSTERPRRRVPVWIWTGGACVAAAGLFAAVGPGSGTDRAQPAPGGVAVTGAQPTGATVVVPPTTAPPTTAGSATPAGDPAPTTAAVQQLLPQPACHPSYSPCVPIDDDVDCAGGTGDGPSYASGPIRVTGPDEYRLDADGDGIACEP